MILDKLVAASKARVEREKEDISMPIMKELANKLPVKHNFPFEEALKQTDMSFICEVKKASPSKGIIAEDFPYVDIAKDYESAGASCISVLTEPDYFLGKNEYLTEIKKAVSIPVLRKDFIIDSYQIYQAKHIGADCILLIASILEKERIKDYIKLCDTLGLSALVEVHNEKEIDHAIYAGARIIGVNNRNLQTFEVDIHTSERLRKLVPESILFVAESGIQTHEQIEILAKVNVNAVLIGETLMKNKNKKEILEILKGNNTI